MALKSSDLQSDSDLDSVRNTCDVQKEDQQTQSIVHVVKFLKIWSLMNLSKSCVQLFQKMHVLIHLFS